MVMRNHTRLDLVEGGNIFKQGEHAQLAFTPRDDMGRVVDLTGKDIAVAIWNKTGIMYEGVADYDSAAQLIRLTVNQILQNGDFQIEFTVTDATDPNYRQKFPSGDFEGKIHIKPSADNLEFVGANVVTVSQLRSEQQQLQQQFEAQVNPKVQSIETEQQRLQIEFYNAAAALTEDSEFILAKGEYGSVPERLNSSDQRLEDIEGEIPWVTPLKFKNMRVPIEGGYDWTPAIQHCLDNYKYVWLPFIPGILFYVSQLIVPNGVTFRGSGLGGFGGSSESSFASQLRQIPGTNKDMIIFKGSTVAGDNRHWIGPLEISGMILYGDNSAASGSGIRFKTVTSDKATIQDTVTIENLLIRGFKEDGIMFTDGALPISVQRVNLLFNGRYGINFETSNFVTQSVDFSHISGDGNLSGLFRIKGARDNGSITFNNPKSEKRINPMYGSAKGQEFAIILEDCDKTAITINGLTHVSSVPDATDSSRYEKPGSAVVIKGPKIPKIFYMGIAMRVRTTDTGADPFTIKDEVYGRHVTKDYFAGYFGEKEIFNVTDPTNGSNIRRVIGGNEWFGKGIETPGFQLQGVTPLLSFSETDQAVDEKLWSMVVSGKTLSLRTQKDDGVTGDIFMKFIRGTGSMMEQIELTPKLKVGKGIIFTPVTPASAVNQELFADSTDGNKLKYKDALGTINPLY